MKRTSATSNGNTNNKTVHGFFAAKNFRRNLFSWRKYLAFMTKLLQTRDERRPCGRRPEE
jgi:hypothetical protein